MAVTDEARHDLYAYFQETMGRARASTMMELLPPEAPATKADITLVRKDLDHLRLTTEQNFSHLREWSTLHFEQKATKTDVADVRTEIANFKAEFHRVMRMQTFATITVLGIITALVHRLG